MIGKIFIQDLLISCRVGMTDLEQRIPQNISVSVTCYVDLAPCLASDALSDVLDYKELADRIYSVVGSRTFNLVETLAGAVADACFFDGRVTRTEISLRKRHRFIPCGYVGVEIMKEKNLSL